jgi:hypothetical protein
MNKVLVICILITLSKVTYAQAVPAEIKYYTKRIGFLPHIIVFSTICY